MDEQPKKLKKLKPTYKRFVARVAQGETPTQAYREIYGASNAVAKNASSMIMKKPQIQEGIRECMERMWPELAPDVKSVLQEIILSPDERTSDRLAAIKMVGEFFGWKAPSKSQHLTAKVDMSKFDLPGSSSKGGDSE